MAEVSCQPLEMDPEQALFDGKLSGLVLTCYENERPLSGLAGLIDWRFQGAMSQCFRRGAVTGKVGECVYFPMTRNQNTYHFIFIGGGFNSNAGERKPLPAEAIKSLHKNLLSLRLANLGLSKKDFGDVTDDALNKNLKGVPLWIVP